jgi:hypothetical protein
MEETEKIGNKSELYQTEPGGEFKEGNPGGGRPKETEEIKIARKAKKELINDYLEALAQALPVLSPVIIKKAGEGDMQAIKEINDRVMGKVEQPVDLKANLVLSIEKEVAEKYNVDRKPENSIERQPQVQGVEVRAEVGKDNTGLQGG